MFPQSERFAINYKEGATGGGAAFHYIKYEVEASEMSYKPEFFFNILMRWAHLLPEFLRKDSLFCSLLVLQPSCHLGDERMNKTKQGYPLLCKCSQNVSLYKTRRNSLDQDSEAITSLNALPGTRLARDHFLQTVHR